ncbi:MAG TPA: plastocyanin/azurin family copper-binding protein [Gemmatimonadaceae bacterium]|nr:plastocyanin/azurin family copper-binding protein [Gemmatimonadaceae bacterium]
MTASHTSLRGHRTDGWPRVARPWRGRRLLTLAAAAAAALVAACARDHPRTHVVDIRGFALQPETLRIAAGDTVRWINHDAVPHNVTAAPGSAHHFDSGSIAAAGEWQLVAPPGQSAYFCVYHPTMRGVVVAR